MPNQMPFNFYGPNTLPNMNNMSNMPGTNPNWNYNINEEIKEIKEQISILEVKIANIEQELKKKNDFGYQTSMHMM